MITGVVAAADASPSPPHESTWESAVARSMLPLVGEKDAVYTAEEAAEDIIAVEGQPKYQQIDHSKLVPLLVKTIQELEARIKTLEG